LKKMTKKYQKKFGSIKKDRTFAPALEKKAVL
jgi:hypothetical protein